MAKKFNDENFEKEVIEKSKELPVLVDFYADWCGPCQMQAPIIEELSNEIGDKAVIGKVDTEESVETSQKFGISSIPSLIIFKDGKPIENLIGLHQKDSLMETLSRHM